MVKTLTMLKQEIILLLEAERYDVVRSYFMCWISDEEMIDKVILMGHIFDNKYT